MISSLIGPYIADWPDMMKGGAVVALLSLLILLRYFVFTGAAFGVSQLARKISPWRRLQAVPYTWNQISREMKDSMISVLVFTAVIGFIALMNSLGWTRLYTEPGEFGWIWFWMQIPVALLIQDLYFYWMHRFAHLPAIYERVHKTHHLSTNPSAFAAFAFHPLEAIFEIAIFVVMVIVLPMNFYALILVGLSSLAYNVYGHLGYEIMPRFIAKSPLGRLLNTSAYHNQHHRTYRYNYGLYTVIWDRLHGTFHPKAETLYDSVTERPGVKDGVTQS